MLVTSGVDFENFDPAINEIFLQLDNVKNGDFEDWEFDSAKKAVITSLETSMDSLNGLEELYFSNAVSTFVYDPVTLIELVKSVTRDRVVAAASDIRPDTIHMLTGSDSSGDNATNGGPL